MIHELHSSKFIWFELVVYRGCGHISCFFFWFCFIKSIIKKADNSVLTAFTSINQIFDRFFTVRVFHFVCQIFSPKNFFSPVDTFILDLDSLSPFFKMLFGCANFWIGCQLQYFATSIKAYIGNRDSSVVSWWSKPLWPHTQPDEYYISWFIDVSLEFFGLNFPFSFVFSINLYVTDFLSDPVL